MFDFLTWTCHICGAQRPDGQIAVMSRDTSAEYGLPEGTMRQNVRYCANNPSCQEQAKTFRWVKNDV